MNDIPTVPDMNRRQRIAEIIADALDAEARIDSNRPDVLGAIGAAAAAIVDEFDVAEKSLIDWGCGSCYTCIEREICRQEDAGNHDAWMQGQFMILCAECGNKRCPKATDHELDCTHSNAPNQPGSRYQTAPDKHLTQAETDALLAKFHAKRKGTST